MAVLCSRMSSTGYPRRSCSYLSCAYSFAVWTMNVSGVVWFVGRSNQVEQQAMLPTVKDPKLWIVKCRPGAEREVCVQLMQKFLDRVRATNLTWQ